MYVIKSYRVIGVVQGYYSLGYYHNPNEASHISSPPARKFASCAAMPRVNFNSTLHQFSRRFVTRVHDFVTKTKALAHEIPPVTQARTRRTYTVYELCAPDALWVRHTSISYMTIVVFKMPDAEQNLKRFVSC